MIYRFEGHSLDVDRRELRRGPEVVAIEPQVFDLLSFLIGQRNRVVSKDDLLAEVWRGRIVSESTLASRVAALRRAVGDSGKQQRLIRTVSRKGFRFVGAVVEDAVLDGTAKEAEFLDVASRNVPRLAGAARPAPLERRQLTIMACCVDEARAIASRLDPEDMATLMARCRSEFGGAVERNGGFVAKHTADGLLAYFGYPRAAEDDPENAVRAGLAALNAVAELRGQFARELPQARVGIATGLVIVGDVNGVDAAPGHEVAGEPLHLATRLLGVGMPGTVVISNGTRQLIGGLFDCRDLGANPSPNEAQSVAAWHVIRESAMLNRFEGLRSSRTRLIGREEELELLLLRWHQAKAGEGRIVLVWGEPGIGKSRLVAALQDALAGDRVSSLRFFCTPHRTQTALHPVVAHFEDAAGFSPGDADETKLEKLARLLASSGGTDRDLVLLADLLSISTGRRYAPLEISAQRRKELLLECFIARLVGLTAKGPLLVVLEDAHWVDPTTREWFDVVVDRMRSLPALFIMTYRPEFNPPWLGQSHVTALTLRRLGRRENALLVKSVAGGRDLPPALLDQIVMQTDGVPLFIEEVTKSVLESGILREADGEFVLAGPLAVPAVPWTLQASLNARIDRLASVRGLVQTCAALGREFGYALVKAVTALPDAELEPLLGQVVASGLVHQRGAVPQATFIFKHALVQDAAYESMLKGQRAAIHARIVQVLEEQFPEILDRNPDIVAHHCRNAGQLGKAIDFAIKAALQALARSAGAESHALVEMAMSLLPGIASEPERQQLEGRLQVALADTLVMTQGFASPQVMSCLSTARRLLNERDHPNESLRALCGQFNYHLMRSESPACLDLAVAMLKPHHDRPTINVVQYLVGTAHLHLGNFADSIRHLETALSLYDEDLCRPVGFVTGHHLRSFTLIWLGLGQLYAGSPRKAAQTMSAAVQDARSRAHPFTLVSALLAVARFRNHVNDLEGAIDATEEGLAIATEQRSPYHVSRANILRAMNMVAASRVEEGIALMQHALAAHRATGANFLSSYNMSSLAEAHARAGDFERAVELADEAVAEVGRSGERWWEAEALRLRAEIQLRAHPKDHKEAERQFRSALACARRQAARLWEFQCAQSLAKLCLAQGRSHEARELLAPFGWAAAEGFDLVDPTLAAAIRAAPRSSAKPADRSRRRPRA